MGVFQLLIHSCLFLNIANVFFSFFDCFIEIVKFILHFFFISAFKHDLIQVDFSDFQAASASVSWRTAATSRTFPPRPPAVSVKSPSASELAAWKPRISSPSRAPNTSWRFTWRMPVSRLNIDWARPHLSSLSTTKSTTRSGTISQRNFSNAKWPLLLTDKALPRYEKFF